MNLEDILRQMEWYTGPFYAKFRKIYDVYFPNEDQNSRKILAKWRMSSPNARIWRIDILITF